MYATLERYLEEIRTFGFSYKLVEEETRFFILVEHRDKNISLIIADIPMHEPLAPELVELYDRRLGITTSFNQKT